MSTNNPTTASNQFRDTTKAVKLPSEIESRFQDTLGDGAAKVAFKDWESCDKAEQFIVTEQVILLESMVSEIEKMKKQVEYGENDFRKPTPASHLGYYNQALDAVIVKVQAKLQEYKS